MTIFTQFWIAFPDGIILDAFSGDSCCTEQPIRRANLSARKTRAKIAQFCSVVVALKTLLSCSACSCTAHLSLVVPVVYPRCCTKGAMPWSFALLCAFDHCCRVDVYLCGCYLGTRLGTYRECFLVNLATTCSHTINGYCHGHTRRYVVATESMLNVESPPPFPFCVKMLIVKWYLNIVANLLEALFLEDWWRTVFTRCMFVICNCWSTIVQCVA